MESKKSNKSLKRKLSDISYLIHKMEIKKSGYNKFIGYSYYELCDIQPVVNELLHEEGILASVVANEHEAKLIFEDLDSDDTKEITMPFKDSNLKNAQDMQNVGASITYARRYLLLMAFGIVEPEQLDATQGDPKFKNQNEKVKELPSANEIRNKIRGILNSLVKDKLATTVEILKKFPSSDQIRQCDQYDILMQLYTEVNQFAINLRTPKNKKAEP